MRRAGAPAGGPSGAQAFIVRFGDDDSDDESGATNLGNPLTSRVRNWELSIIRH